MKIIVKSKDVQKRNKLKQEALKEMIACPECEAVYGTTNVQEDHKDTIWFGIKTCYRQSCNCGCVWQSKWF